MQRDKCVDMQSLPLKANSLNVTGMLSIMFSMQCSGGRCRGTATLAQHVVHNA